MVTERSMNMLSEMGMRSPMLDGVESELGAMLQEHRRQEMNEHRRQDMNNRDRDLSMYRSGSAPPTVEGSLSAVGGLYGGGGHGGGVGGRGGDCSMMSEEEIRSDPTYLNYYYANVNMNPRLPPPLVSKEDWRSAQRVQSGGSGLGGIGDRRKTNHVEVREDGGSRSLFSLQPGFGEGANEFYSRNELDSGERGGDGLIGLSGLGLGSRQKSFADMFQDDLGHLSPALGNPSRPTSRNSYNNGVEILSSAEAQLAQIHHDMALKDVPRSANVQGISAVHNVIPASHTHASTLGASLSRSNSTDLQHIARARSPCLPPVGGGRLDKRSINGPKAFHSIPSSMGESTDLVAALSGMSLSKTGVIDDENRVCPQIQQDIDEHHNFLASLHGGHNNFKQNQYLKRSESGRLRMVANQQDELLKPPVSSADLHCHSILALNSPGGSPQYQSVDVLNSAFANYSSGGNTINQALPSAMVNQLGHGNMPPLFENAAAASAMAATGMDARALGSVLPVGTNLAGLSQLQNIHRMGNQSAGNCLQGQNVDPLYLQYLSEYAAVQMSALNDPSLDRNCLGMDLLGLHKAYLGAMLSPQKSQYGVPFLEKSVALNHGYYENPTFGLGVPYPILPSSPVGPGSPLRHNERNMRFPSGMRNLAGGVMESWHLQGSGNMDESWQPSSLLEEFKSNKTKCSELSEIAGHVVEFSADQYGSRFIQQKLETATSEEKIMVFQEIMPDAFTLMTDVFGNYVIQKFFEHGTVSQRRELADQLNGHVLALSLQMYGCRVIQKAIEVVSLDQQTKMVNELDGHVMRCVRDQNGNHVIQKCIECIPQDAIEFIISCFYDQVVTLSTHPYGCRVIQRVLEYCDNPKTQQIMMDEIMQHVCKLAKDQYGNYVVQHVLQHGKPHERSAIIKELAGQIVEMSQQKFASNVVEKCLAFGGPAERQFVVNEMLGTTDENEPLQAMMKDQFANYVVQKVLETCDDQQRELILSRIKVHLNALKKYTYGKHIVARVEKLVAAGERRIGMMSLYSA